MIMNEQDFNFDQLVQYALLELKLSEQDIQNLPSVKRAEYAQLTPLEKATRKISWNILLCIFCLLVSLTCGCLLNTDYNKIFIKGYLNYMHGITDADGLTKTECLLFTPEPLLDLFRPPVDCNECKDVLEPKYITNISAIDFVENYAFTMQPLVILDGQKAWDAKDVFSYEYFKRLYSINKNTDTEFIDVCQFFPYKTPMVENMKDFLTMPDKYFVDSSTPWYVGWSNCNGVVASELRKHYRKPYFIPESLDHAKTDWIFMGVPGYGAHLHIDSVDTMSWQAQIRGKKLWTLESPPECHSICSPHMEIVVEPGNIVVLDTNKWFHSTNILGDEVSIVIGSEYF